jgi:hypothetical protein
MVRALDRAFLLVTSRKFGDMEMVGDDGDFRCGVTVLRRNSNSF